MESSIRQVGICMNELEREREIAVGDRSIDPWSARHTCTCVNDEQEEGEKKSSPWQPDRCACYSFSRY